MNIIGYVWLASIIIAACGLNIERWHSKAKMYLWWALFPFYFIFHPKRLGIVKSWLLFLISPCMVFVHFVAFRILLMFVMFQTEDGPAVSIPYHTNEDLKKITGVEFPEVIPVDSTWHDDFNYSETAIKFVPLKPLDRKFFRRLETACQDDPCCWQKDSLGYHYFIYPERPIDRPNGTHIRKVEMNGEKVDDWDGDFIAVQIPFKGDTIYVSDGWCR